MAWRIWAVRRVWHEVEASIVVVLGVWERIDRGMEQEEFMTAVEARFCCDGLTVFGRTVTIHHRG